LLSLLGCGGIAIIDDTGSSGDGGAGVGAGANNGAGAGASAGGPGAGGSTPPVCEDVSGVWAGGWNTNSGLSGTWEVDWLEDDDGTIAGFGLITGTQCGMTADIEGQRDGCDIRFGVVDFGGCDVDFGGDLDGSTMGGTFTVTLGFSDSGTWSGSRQ